MPSLDNEDLKTALSETSSPTIFFCLLGLGKGTGRPLPLVPKARVSSCREHVWARPQRARSTGLGVQRTGPECWLPGNWLGGFGSGPSCSSLSFPICKMSALGVGCSDIKNSQHSSGQGLH